MKGDSVAFCSSAIVGEDPLYQYAAAVLRLLPIAAEREAMPSYARSVGESPAEWAKRKAEVAV